MAFDLNFTRCCAKNLSYLLTLFFIFILVAAIINNFFNSSLKPVDSNDLPKDFPLLAIWDNDTGTVGCRIITKKYVSELSKKVGKIRYSPINQADKDACQFALDYFQHKAAWPVTIKTDLPQQHSSVYYQQNQQNIKVVCNLENNQGLQSQYQVKNGDIINSYFLMQKKQSFNVKTLPYAFLITLLLWFFYKLYKQYNLKRKQAANTQH